MLPIIPYYALSYTFHYPIAAIILYSPSPRKGQMQTPVSPPQEESWRSCQHSPPPRSLLILLPLLLLYALLLQPLLPSPPLAFLLLPFSSSPHHLLSPPLFSSSPPPPELPRGDCFADSIPLGFNTLLQGAAHLGRLIGFACKSFSIGNPRGRQLKALCRQLRVWNFFLSFKVWNPRSVETKWC